MKLNVLKRRKIRRIVERNTDGEWISPPVTTSKSVLTVDEDGDLKSIEINKVKQKKKIEKTDFRYIGLGYYLIVPLLLGVFVGLMLDKLFNTKPFFLVSFLLLGTGASFYNLFKVLRNE